MKKFIRFLLILFLLIALVVIYARYGGTEGLKTKEYTIETKDIATTFDGIKIVHFSDLHYLRVTDKNKLKQIVDEINLINPDIVFFTGDLIDKDFTTTDKDKDDLIEELNNIKSKYGKYAIIGNHDHVKDINLLKDNLTMCENAIEFLKKYMDHLLSRGEEKEAEIDTKYSYLDRSQIYQHVSYDLWEMNEGVHLYSLSAIYAAFGAMELIYKELQKDSKKFRLPEDFNELAEYKELIKNYILENLCDKKQNILLRNTKDNYVDISIMGAITPFNVFDPNDKLIQNTVQKINLTLRTYTGGYLRFENDGYMGGKNPWPIATLWMYIYYKKIGATNEANECLKFVIDTATPLGLLAEQIDNEQMKSKWVIGLGWSHAMFILSLGLEELLNKN